MARTAFSNLPALAVAALSLLAATSAALGQHPADNPVSTREGVEFFEKRIRPLLAQNCYRCHGEKEHKSGLRLDSVDRILSGGERGPAVVPGSRRESRLIRAVSYTDPDLQMPPDGKLEDEQIAALVAWVEMGAPGPRDVTKRESPDPSTDSDFRVRLEHWAYQPVRRPEPPDVAGADWPTSLIDHFILAKLEEAGLSPAPPADKRTLIRRVTFDLIGLPPTPEEVAAFLADDAPDAYARLVERLLESPHYGERWARHWLDLVRFAETLGHEFDFDIYNAWRYRDYVIRALNADVPYDQFVVEHVAGDLLPNARRHPTEGYNESVIGTGFFWLGEGKHSPVDVRQEQADRMDNQIDVFGKAFLGQTIACARCHDHKFDPITAQDYYSLAGYLKSSRYQQAFIDPPERITAIARRLAELRRETDRLARDQVAQRWIEQAGETARYLVAARDAGRGASVEQAAAETGLDPERLRRWMGALARDELRRPKHPFFAWVQLAPSNEGDATRAKQTALEQIARGGKPGLSVLFEDFTKETFDGWFVSGDAFGDGPSRAAFVADPEAGSGLRVVAPGQAHSGLLSSRLEGVLRSRTFTIDADYMHFLAAGRASRINLVIDGFTLIRNPIYGGLIVHLDDDALAWRTMNVGMWRGHRAYLEIVDSTTPNPTHGTESDVAGDEPGTGYIVVDAIRFSDDRKPPVARPHALNEQLLSGGAADSFEAVALRYQTAIVEAIERCRDGAARACDVDLMNWLLENGLLDGAAAGDELAELRDRYRKVEQQIPRPRRAVAMADGTAEDEYVFVRGSYKIPGDRAPRRLLAEICRDHQPEPTEGSGRLALARRLVDGTNPLTARVLVNRLWQHHFGTGIVATPDDFGHMGRRPTHPELLDYLASELVRRGWSIKALHRQMVLSSTYRMSNEVAPEARNLDPQNRLLHHMPVRRLEAEAIRDNVLAVSGELDRTLYGRGVAPYLTPFMEGRGRPKSSGPLDGDGRRSIYINVRRNFLTPMFLAFDYPIPFTARGRRGTSNVPAQALTMMNSPFVVEQARKWAERIASQSDKSTRERIRAMYTAAFARPPTERERDDAVQFLQQQAGRYGDADSGDVQAWADLCHVLMNVKEFIFVR